MSLELKTMPPDPDIVVVQQPQTTVVIQETSNAVTVAASGAQGPAGPQGEPGTPGAPGGTRFSHVQSVASTFWPIAHNLGYRPHVTVLVNEIDVSEGVEVEHLDLNNVAVRSGMAISGRAELS